MKILKIEKSRTTKDKETESRFDFGSKQGSDTGSLQELVKELNNEYLNSSGEAITPKSLDGAIDFIHLVTGVKIEKSNRKIPVTTLKTIKLLFLKSRDSGKHLLQNIKHPELNKITMEFCTASTVSRDKASAKIISSILDEMAKEIPEIDLKLHLERIGGKKYTSTAEMFIEFIESTNNKIYELIAIAYLYDDSSISKAYLLLSKDISNYTLSGIDKVSDIKIHESIYVYLTTLGIRHFINGQRDTVIENKIKNKIGSISHKVEAFLDNIRSSFGLSVKPNDRIFSVNNFYVFVNYFSEDVLEFIKIATGYETDKRKLLQNTVRAKPLLMCYAYRSFNEENPDATVLSLVDIIAALCAFRYVQKSDIQYKPYWHGQEEQGSVPQRLYDKGWCIKAGKLKKEINVNDVFQHQGVFRIYYDIFSEYQSQFNGRTNSYNAWMNFQLSRLSIYEKIFKIKSINKMWDVADNFDIFCIDKAKNIIFPSIE